MGFISSKIDCPTCKTSISTRLDYPFAFKCKNCNTSFEVFSGEKINDLDIKHNSISFFSLITIGNLGKYENNEFEIIGYIRSVNSYYISNEWLMNFTNGTKKWLVEVQGSYFIFEDESHKLTTENIRYKKALSKITLKEKNFIVTCISKQIDFSFEGQIKLESVNPQQYFIFDLIGETDQECASVCIYDKTDVEISYGKKINLIDLGFEVVTKSKWV